MPTTHEIITENVTHQIVDEIFQHVISEEIITHIIEAEQGPIGPQGVPWDGISNPWEIPSWTINWVNTNFVLSNTPTNWVKLYLNWMRQISPTDYSLSSNIVTFTSAPTPWDIILADYNF